MLRKGYDMRKALAIIIIVLSIAIPISAFVVYHIYYTPDYNNGICIECGTPYTIHHYLMRGTSYIKYVCDNCGHTGHIEERFTY